MTEQLQEQYEKLKAELRGQFHERQSALDVREQGLIRRERELERKHEQASKLKHTYSEKLKDLEAREVEVSRAREIINRNMEIFRQLR